MDPTELISACEEMVRTFNPIVTTVDSHAAEFIKLKKVVDADDKMFLEQVLYGVVRYKKMLKVFLSSLYFKHGGETQRAKLDRLFAADAAGSAAPEEQLSDFEKFLENRRKGGTDAEFYARNEAGGDAAAPPDIDDPDWMSKMKYKPPAK